MKTKTKLTVSVLALVLAVSLTVASTFAWFTMNAVANVKTWDMKVTTQSDLQIAVVAKSATAPLDGEYSNELDLTDIAVIDDMIDTTDGTISLTAVTPNAADEKFALEKAVDNIATAIPLKELFVSEDKYVQIYTYTATDNIANGDLDGQYFYDDAGTTLYPYNQIAVDPSPVAVLPADQTTIETDEATYPGALAADVRYSANTSGLTAGVAKAATAAVDYLTFDLYFRADKKLHIILNTDEVSYTAATGFTSNATAFTTTQNIKADGLGGNGLGDGVATAKDTVIVASGAATASTAAANAVRFATVADEAIDPVTTSSNANGERLVIYNPGKTLNYDKNLNNYNFAHSYYYSMSGTPVQNVNDPSPDKAYRSFYTSTRSEITHSTNANGKKLGFDTETGRVVTLASATNFPVSSSDTGYYYEGKVTCYIWLEGADPDTFEAIYAHILKSTLSFVGVTA